MVGNSIIDINILIFLSFCLETLSDINQAKHFIITKITNREREEIDISSLNILIINIVSVKNMNKLSFIRDCSLADKLSKKYVIK